MPALIRYLLHIFNIISLIVFHIIIIIIINTIPTESIYWSTKPSG